MDLTANDLIQVQKMIVSATIIQSGDLKAELDAIVAASAELDSKLAIVKTMEEADAYKAAAVTEVAQQQAVLDQLAGQHAAAVVAFNLDKAGLEVERTDAANKMADALNQQTVTAQATAALAMEVATAQEAMASDRIENDKIKQTLVDRENAVKAGEIALQARINKLSAI